MPGKEKPTPTYKEYSTTLAQVQESGVWGGEHLLFLSPV